VVSRFDGSPLQLQRKRRLIASAPGLHPTPDGWELGPMPPLAWRLLRASLALSAEADEGA